MAAGYHRPPTQFGITVQPHASFVFFHRVLKLAQDKGLSVPAILSHVVSHELGHLLLGEGNHSDLGIMSEDLQLRKFRQAEKGELMTFTAEQARLMRAKLAEELVAEK